jgi:tetraacyldisaccharide 4'-kinase
MTMPSVREVWERAGARGKLLWFFLLPAAFLYALGTQARNFFYSLGWLKSARLPKPVVSVGNLTVGGTGKTPTCLWLAGELKNHGLRVGILSRGYQRAETRPLVLQPQSLNGSGANHFSDVSKAGDEPSMMTDLYGQVVGIGKNRGLAAAELLRQTDVDVFILDDGFQHRRVRRDVDLLLMGSDFSGWTLPAGPFREPRRNYQRADFLLLTGAPEKWRALIAPARVAAAFAASLQPVSLLSLSSGQRKEFPLTVLYRSKILAVTGVADPRGFYRMIHDWEGEIVETLEFPDHHDYSARDWQQINRVGRLVDLIVTTEKDILKLVRFPFARDKLVALRVAMQVENGADLVRAIVARIHQAQSGAPQ